MKTVKLWNSSKEVGQSLLVKVFKTHLAKVTWSTNVNHVLCRMFD